MSAETYNGWTLWADRYRVTLDPNEYLSVWRRKSDGRWLFWSSTEGVWCTASAEMMHEAVRDGVRAPLVRLVRATATKARAEVDLKWPPPVPVEPRQDPMFHVEPPQEGTASQSTAAELARIEQALQSALDDLRALRARLGGGGT